METQGSNLRVSRAGAAWVKTLLLLVVSKRWKFFPDHCCCLHSAEHRARNTVGVLESLISSCVSPLMPFEA